MARLKRGKWEIVGPLWGGDFVFLTSVFFFLVHYVSGCEFYGVSCKFADGKRVDGASAEATRKWVLGSRSAEFSGVQGTSPHTLG